MKLLMEQCRDGNGTMLFKVLYMALLFFQVSSNGQMRKLRNNFTVEQVLGVEPYVSVKYLSVIKGS